MVKDEESGTAKVGNGVVRREEDGAFLSFPLGASSEPPSGNVPHPYS
jgi:hypothetical protein